MVRFLVSSHTIGRFVIATISFLIASFWLILTSISPNSLPSAVESKGIAFIPLFIAGFFLLTDLLVWDRTAAPISVQHFLGKLIMACSFGTLVVTTGGIAFMAMGQDVAKFVALIFVGGCGLGIAIVDCSLWYVYDTAPKLQVNNAASPRTAGATTIKGMTPSNSRLKASTRLPAWRRQAWLAACLVAVALPLSAFSLILAQPPGSDWSDTALLLALLGGIWPLILLPLRSTIIGKYQ